jgi:hypothetical protein
MCAPTAGCALRASLALVECGVARLDFRDVGCVPRWSHHRSGADIRRKTGPCMTNSACLNVHTLSMGHTLIDTKPHDPIVSHRGRSSSRRRLYTAHECSEPAHTAAVSFWAVAHLLAREQLPASATPLSQVRLLLAPQRKRSSAPDPVCEANTEDTVRYGRHAFLACLPYSQVCAHEVHR